VKTALVTGATRGIGRAAAIALGDAGWWVLASGRDAEAGKELQAELEARSGGMFVRADLTEPEAPTALVAHAVEGTGRLDALVNNAGIHRVAALVRLHEPGEALEYARTIDPASISSLPPERKVTYMLDLTTAYTETGQYADAARTLVDAERVAPEEVRCRPLAHGLLRAMLRNTSGELGRSVQRMASRAGVTA
jgi:hypothetical protein